MPSFLPALKYLPNLLSSLRIVLACLMITSVSMGHLNGVTFLVFAAGITDFLDGYIARRYGLETFLGKMLDPVADKIFLSGMMLVLFGVYRLLPLWFIGLVVGRDLAIMMSVFLLRNNQKSHKMLPSWLSKINTVLQIGLVFFILCALEFGLSLKELPWMIGCVATTTFLSGLQYGRWFLLIK